MATATKSKTIKIINCKQCPHCVEEDGGQGTKNFYCYHPNDAGRTIAYHAENKTEEPQDGKFPKWCPL